jgi:hypothetical protein
MKLRSMLLPLLIVMAAVQGCHSGGSGSGSSSSTVRLVNATTNFASLDLISAGTKLASGVATGSASSFSSINSGSNVFALESGGSGTPSAQATLTFASGGNYTLVAYTSGQQLQVASFAESEPAPASGDGKIRISNLSQDAGSVDVYMAQGGGTLATASALTTFVTGTTTSYFEITKGTYHIWITGAGNIADVRLDLPSVVISDQQILTLMLTSTKGGTLVDGLFITQAGAVSAQKNTSARIRLAANIAANGNVAATANGVSLASTLRSPVVGPYTLVPAGALSMSVLVNGGTVNVGTLNAVAGADLTLLAVGTAASPQFFLLNDDNTRPLGGMAKLRLVNGVNGLGDNISLTADYNLIALAVTPGTASATANVNSGIISRLEANSVQANTSLYLATNVTLTSPGVYTLFMLGDNNPAPNTPVGILRRDR